MAYTTYSAPPDTGTVQLGHTLPSLLDEVCDRHPNSYALQQWGNQRWESLSHTAFRLATEEIALGLLDLSLRKGDRVSLLMNSDVHFCLADMAILLAGGVTVAIDQGLNSEAIRFILSQAEPTVLIVSNYDLLKQIAPDLAPSIKAAIVVNAQGFAPAHLPPSLEVLTWQALQARGKALWTETTPQQLRGAIAPNDPATIVYTAGVNGQPKGVVLSHESLAGNILASFSGMPRLKPGLPEIALIFLPLTHIFARVFWYGHLYYSHQVYFTTPNWVSKHLQEVRPTIFITVPRLLEKAHEKILEQGQQIRGVRRWFFDWGVGLARRYRLGKPPRGFYALQLKLANRLVFPQWRAGFGGRVKYLVSGGAALSGELANVFSAAGIPIFQGYGLTESGSALCANRGRFNQAGTVGIPIAGVEMAIAPDGEVLAKTPYGMQGYYRDADATRKAIDAEGWLHTGDIGEFTAEGFLKITGHKKSLFKLSTGKYVAPLPIEQQLKRSPFVQQAIVVGSQRKFCSLLIFPNLDHLCPQAEGMCLALPLEEMLKHGRITALYQALIDDVNRSLPQWSTIKRFRLLHLTMTLEDGVEKPTLTIKRDSADQIFAAEIEAMYRENGRKAKSLKPKRKAAQPQTPADGLGELQPIPIPVNFLQALNSRFTTLRSGGHSNHV